MKTKLIFLLILILLTGSLATCTVLFLKERQKSVKLESNIKYGYETGFKITEYYKAKNGQLVARNHVLELESKQFVDVISEDIKYKLNNLGINPRKVKYYSETAIETDKIITSKVRDSIVFKDSTRVDTIHAELFNYQDEFYKISGIKIGNCQQLSISSCDSILQVVYKGARYNRKGNKIPGIFFWIPRRMEQVITCKNPASKVTYSKTILITK